MEKKLIVAVALMVLLFSCKTKYVYVDRPVSTPAPTAATPAPTSTDNKPYQAQPGDYSPAPVQNTQPPVTNTQTYSDPNQNNYPPNNSGGQVYNGNQNNSDQYYTQESDQDYYYHQQRVNYGGNPSYQVFYDELAPYGSWVDYPGYGYVWIPAQGPGFRPYVTNGYWAYSEYGWTWVSNYNWGWAPFHYGNWMMDPMYGWVWVPGHTWAPAWVSWGQCNGYYGWAPIAPGVAYHEGYRPPVSYWNFVREGDMNSPYVSNHVVNHTENITIVNNNTTNIVVINNQVMHNNAKYYSGPEVGNVERATGRKVQAVTLAESSKPVAVGSAVSAGRISIYRPAVAPPTAVKAAPAAVVPIQTVKTVNASAVKGVLPRTSPSHSTPDIRNAEPVQHNPAQPGEPQKTGNSNPSNPYDPSKERPVGPPLRRPIEKQPEQKQPEQKQPEQRQPEQRQPQQPPVQERPSQPVQRQPEQRPAEQPIQRQPEQRPASQPAQRQPEQRPVERKAEPVQRNTNTQPRQAPKPAPKPQPASKEPVKHQ